MEYSYENGCMLVHQNILPGYKRFNRCNAQWARLEIEYLDIIQFISYSTKILQIVHNTKYDTWEMCINNACFEYSRTTSKQVAQFLRFITDQPFTVPNVQQAIKSDVCRCDATFGSVYAVSLSTLERLWR